MKNSKEKKTNGEKKEDKEATDRAKKAKERALVKIEGNIKKIYLMLELQESMIDIKGYLRIYKPSKEDMEKINEMRSIKKIIEYLKNSWLERIYKNKKLAEVIGACHARVCLSLELDEQHDKIEAARTKNELYPIRTMGERYLRDSIDNFLYNGYNHIFEKHKVNNKIWKHILGAMLFNVPERTVLRVKNSIMPDYMPRINENLQIQINELTKMGEIEAILGKIKDAQARYKKRFKYKNFEK
ncbi:hypothetical protein KAR28_05325 [Candidatus Parcubacteria bacterium]|nr:hypothetical protein [Candidatus Parcubacteria bacterium]